MIGRLGLLISRIFRRTAPDPFVLAILLTLLTALLALSFGEVPGTPGTSTSGPTSTSALLALFDAWRSNAGIFKLLDFAMQMCLILVSGHALASSGPASRAIARLADWPQNTRQAAVMVSFVACFTSVFNWGLALITGALLARATGRSLARRGIRAHYPLLCAAGYMGLLVWHGGFSGSAPLTMTNPVEAAKVLPPAYVERLGGHGVPLTETTFSSLNVFVTLGLLFGIPALMGLLAPKNEADLLPIDVFGPARAPAAPVGPPVAAAPSETIPDRLDRSPLLAFALGVPLLLVLVRHIALLGAASLDLKAIIAGMVGLGLLLHGSPRSYLGAIEDGAGACGGIILQFPLYAGIMAMMEGSGLVRRFADALTALGPPAAVPITSFLAACVINMFIPSGGGHWAVQGPVALESGLRAGVNPGKMILSVAYGGEVTDMLQPFWALPLLAIVGVKARDIVGYTAIVMVFAAAWMLLGLVLF